MALVDAHLHLPEYGDAIGVVDRAPGVCLFSCTVKPAQAEVNLKLRDERPGLVRCFLGVHPSDVTDALPSEQLSRFVSGCDGVGEIGLDPKYSEVGRESLQMKAFLDQLSLAERLGKPVQVHSRGSEKACLEVLGTFRLRSVLMHWFEGEEEQLQLASSRGYYFSFGPALLYSKKIRRIAERVSAERLLTESDGPVAFNALGGASGPNLIASVLFRLGEVRGLSFEDVERTVEENARRYLGAERLI
jgi:TatD DNase family protein